MHSSVSEMSSLVSHGEKPITYEKMDALVVKQESVPVWEH